MRILLLCLLCLSFVIFYDPAAHGQGRTPVPPGVREADKLPNPADVPPLMKPVQKIADPAQLQHEAEELARLAQNIPSQIHQVLKGQLPKGLSEQLRLIEKVSKHLRREISR